MGKHKRPRLSRAQWEGHLASQQASGLTVAAYCRQHKLTASNFYARRREQSGCGKTPSPFIRLSEPDMAPQLLCIHTPEGYRLEFVPGTQPEYIRSVLSGLRA